MIQKFRKFAKEFGGKKTTPQSCKRSTPKTSLSSDLDVGEYEAWDSCVLAMIRETTLRI